MADIVVFVGGISAMPTGSDIKVSGMARTSGMTTSDADIIWETSFAATALTSTINTAIKDAAVSAAADRGITVGALDKKTLLAGGVGL